MYCPENSDVVNFYLANLSSSKTETDQDVDYEQIMLSSSYDYEDSPLYASPPYNYKSISNLTILTTYRSNNNASPFLSVTRRTLIATLRLIIMSAVEASFFAFLRWGPGLLSLGLGTVGTEYPGMFVSAEADCPGLSAKDQGIRSRRFGPYR